MPTSNEAITIISRFKAARAEAGEAETHLDQKIDGLYRQSILTGTALTDAQKAEIKEYKALRSNVTKGFATLGPEVAIQLDESAAVEALTGQFQQINRELTEDLKDLGVIVETAEIVANAASQLDAALGAFIKLAGAVRGI